MFLMGATATDVKARCVGTTRRCVSWILSGDIIRHRGVAEEFIRSNALNPLNPRIISLPLTLTTPRWLGAYPSGRGLLLGSD